MTWLNLAFFALMVFFLWRRFGGKVSSAEARKLVAEGALLLDVRTPGEFASGHLDGAVNVPVGELGQRLAQVEPKDRPVVVYCASGMRSASAVGMLRSAGWAKVVDLGAMMRW